jgi:Flp pilus assembly secretin CpaC
LDASNIEIEVDNNEVTLTGSVDTRYEKRRAEDLAESVSGVNNVQNNLRVVPKNTNYNSGYNTNLENSSSYSSTEDTTKISSKRSS